MHQYWKHDAEVDIRQAYRRGNGFMFIFSTFFVKLYSDAKVAFLESDYLEQIKVVSDPSGADWV